MEKFYFCNFLGKSVTRKVDKGVTKVEVSDILCDRVQEAKAYLVEEGEDTLTLKFVSADETSNGTLFDFIGKLNAEDKKVKSTEMDLRHTDENPIIVVATKQFKIHKGIPTYIKYVPVNGGVLVALIKGFISVMGEDGDMLQLSRNYYSEADQRGCIYGEKEVYTLNSITDKESDIPFSNYVVNDAIIHLDVTKDNREIANYKFSREHFGIMFPKVFEEGRVQKAEAKAKAEEEARLRKEREREWEAREAERERLAMLEEEAKAKAKAAAKRKSSQKPKKEPKEVTEAYTGAAGAMSFLAHIEKIKKENGSAM